MTRMLKYHRATRCSYIGTKSMLRSVNRRHVFVFNDLVLLMSDDKGDKLHFHQAIPLANAHLRDLMYANALDNR